MGKKIWYILGGVAALVVLLVVLGLGAAWYLGAFDPPLLRYAPEDADLIVYVNCRKIATHRIVKSLGENKAIKAQLEKTQKKSEISLIDLLNSEFCIFAKTEKPELTLLARFHSPLGGVPKKVLRTGFHQRVFAAVGMKGDAAEEKIGGDPARVVKDGKAKAALVALDHRLLQGSVVPEDKPFRLVKKGGVAPLARRVDDQALISAAYRVTASDRKELEKLKEMGIDVLGDLEFVTANLRDRGSDLELKVELVFGSRESAGTAEKLLQELHKELKDDPEAAKEHIEHIHKLLAGGHGASGGVAVEEELPEDGHAVHKKPETPEDQMLKKLLDDIKIATSGTTVTLTLTRSSDELIKFLNSESVVKFILKSLE